MRDASDSGESRTAGAARHESVHGHSQGTSSTAHGLSRRRLLAAAAGAVTLGLAGCTGDGEDGGDGGESPTATGTPTGTDQPDLTEPATVPGDASCAVCGMTVSKFPEWNAQLAHEDGERVHFCTSGCLAAYHADPGHFREGRTWDTVVAAWVRDYNTTGLVDATTVHYVLELDTERVDDPMMKNPLPFADRADAVAYVDQYDDLSETDVVRLSAFDRDLAETYRGTFF